MALFQFHWQKRTDPSVTEFVEQSPEIENHEAAMGWFVALTEKHKDEAEKRAADAVRPVLRALRARG